MEAALEEHITDAEVVDEETEHDQRVQACFDLESKIKDNMAQTRVQLWALASDLYLFNEANGHTALGYETQEEWLAQPEIGLTRTQFFRMVRRHRQLVVRRQIPMSTLVELEPSKVDIVIPTITMAKAPLEDVLADCKTLGARDLRERYVGEFLDDDDDPPADPPVDPPEGSAGVNGGDPVSAADVGLSEEDKAARALEEALMGSAGVVDSWIELGGDRRKAARHWARVLEDHPFFRAVKELEKAVEGAEDAVPRAELGSAWETIVSSLNLSFPEGQES